MIKDKVKRNEYMNAYMKRKYSARRDAAIQNLGGKCIKCGCAEGLHFDHVDPSTKIATIARLASYSEAKFSEEVAKCQLLCVNCHALKTIEERSNSNKSRHTQCYCGKVFQTVKQYAGHKRWCNNSGR